MLLHQAVRGFERWFGVRPEVTAELRALVEADLGATTPVAAAARIRRPSARRNKKRGEGFSA